MNLNIINFINILSTGIVIAVAFMIFILGSKVTSTKFNALFWAVISLYLLFLSLENNNIFASLKIAGILQAFIPASYALFLMVHRNNKFKLYHLSILLIPLLWLFLFSRFEISAILYHLIFWAILIISTTRLKKENTLIIKENKKAAIISILLIILAVFPFIIFNIIFLLILKKNFVIELMLPPCIAAASLLGLISSYNNNLLILNHDFYLNLDHLKKSAAFEKKTIIEKIAASLIHEIKNPITAIQSLNEQLKQKINKIPEDKMQKYLDTIGNDLNRIKEISNSFLKACKRDAETKKQSFNLTEILNTIYEIIKYDLDKKEILFQIDSSNNNYSINFDEYKFRQIILNLVYNAMEAGAKNIKIYSKKENKYIKIFIEDNGSGIDRETQSKIFTPFYTTKLDGTGMGLSICKEILNEDYGNIELLASEKGKTVFLITIEEKK